MLCLDVGGGSDSIRKWRGVKRARCSGVLSLMDRFFEKQVCKHVNCCGCIALWSEEDTVSMELKIWYLERHVSTSANPYYFYYQYYHCYYYYYCTNIINYLYSLVFVGWKPVRDHILVAALQLFPVGHVSSTEDGWGSMTLCSPWHPPGESSALLREKKQLVRLIHSALLNLPGPKTWS